jgi:multidrug efflux pump subunit AcrA (membrane-fusion protein)
MRMCDKRGSVHRLVRLVLVLPAVLLTACQVVQTPAPPASQLAINPAAIQSGPVDGTTSANAADGTTTTYTVRRDSLKQSLSIQGRVAPTRSAQLAVRAGGTVTAVNARVGQTVHQGDVLAEFAVDDESLKAARTQATLARLAYESEQSKLNELQAGAPKDSVEQARATVARDQAAIAQLQQQQAAAQAAGDRAQSVAAVTKDAADRKVQLAQVALQSATDTLAAAQDAARQADEVTRGAQAQTRSDAAAAVDSTTLAVRSADRAVKQASIKLDQAKMQWATTRASQALETQQLKVDLDNDAVKGAKAADQAAQTGTAVQAAQADEQLAAAKRALMADSLELDHDKTNLAAAKTVDNAAVTSATLDLEAAQEQLTQAQAAQQKAEQRVQNLARQLPAGQTPQLTPEVAQAAVKQAQHGVDTATINLQEAHAAADQAALGADGASGNVPPAPDSQSMEAAQAQLTADQTRLAGLLAGTSLDEISREQARVNLLHDQADAAAAATQPVSTLTAPFDGTVTDVGINVGQTFTAGGAADGSIATVPATLAGQTTQGQPVAIRIVAAGQTSIVADASEGDIAQLSQGQAVDVSFPGLSNQTTGATITQIASTPTMKDGKVSYPVQIDVSSTPANLKMGMTAQVFVSALGADQVLIAPRGAVHTVAGQPSVTKVDSGGQWADVPVQLGRSSGGNVELVSGAQEGDRIVLYAAAVVAVQPPTTSQH